MLCLGLLLVNNNMDKLLKREDVKKCDKWNIESVYGSLDEYNKDYNIVKNNIDNIKVEKLRRTLAKIDLLMFFFAVKIILAII